MLARRQVCSGEGFRPHRRLSRQDLGGRTMPCAFLTKRRIHVPTITSSYHQQVRSTPEKIAIQTVSEAITYREWHTVVCKTANWIHSTTGTLPQLVYSCRTVSLFFNFLQVLLWPAVSPLHSIPSGSRLSSTALDHLFPVFNHHNRRIGRPFR